MFAGVWTAYQEIPKGTNTPSITASIPVHSFYEWPLRQRQSFAGGTAQLIEQVIQPRMQQSRVARPGQWLSGAGFESISLPAN